MKIKNYKPAFLIAFIVTAKKLVLQYFRCKQNNEVECKDDAKEVPIYLKFRT